MASMEQPNPAAVRKQRSSFLASLNRSISPPPDTINAPHHVIRDGDLELAPRKRRRLSMNSETPTELNSGERQLIPSPFQLTKIQDLPNAENIDTVTLHDLLGNPLIREAWIFNYVFDVDWTMLHFDPDIRSDVSVKIIHGSWKNEDQNKQGIDDACQRWPNVKAIQAYLPDAFGTHHTKMIVLLRHDDIAEIIIHTANMQAGDWTHATQAVWRTLPLQKGGSSIEGVSPDDLRIGSGERFKWDFLRYLKAYGKKLGSLAEEISQYDFSTIRGQLVGSVPSKVTNVYAEEARTKCWGHPAIHHALTQLRQQTSTLNESSTSTHSKHPHIVAQCSSVATLKAGWLEDTLLKAFKAMQPNIKHTLSIVYPTAPEVAASLAGYSCGGSIHMKIQSPAHQKQVAALRPHLCRWNRAAIGEHAFRELAAPHIKTYMSFQKEPTAENPSPAINWALLTSANLSIQAWGTEPKMPTPAKGKVKSKFDAKEAEVHIQSYELGVLVWPELWADNTPEGHCTMVPTFAQDLPQNTVSQTGTVIGLRMPYDLPLTQYSTTDTPWSPHVPHPEPDRHGRTFSRF
jgi:tyrosyl-DNA phosphodiesterase-1